MTMKLDNALPLLNTILKGSWQGGKMHSAVVAGSVAGAYEFSDNLVGVLDTILSPELAAQAATGGSGLIIAGLLAGIRLFAGWWSNRK